MSEPLKDPPTLGTGVRVTRSAGGLTYTSIADWIVLRERDKPIASLFFTAYLLDGADAKTRPITFVFNGGPGASSVYLHLGLVGPRRVAFSEKGDILAPPAHLVDNPESWLPFTDIVCIDPIGTGLSRSHEPQEDPEKPKPSRFWEVKRDLASIGEAISRFLSKEKRWSSPIVLAGESYGGFRVARLARTLPEDFGIGLTAAILISPGIELSSLLPSDYNLEHWVELFPSLAATAHAHGRAGEGRSEAEHRAEAEAFASGDLLLLLAQGVDCSRTEEICARASALIGLPASMIAGCHGRVRRDTFCRELLRTDQRFVGRYDGTVTVLDPFPDREMHEGPDPTLFGLDAVFAVGINTLLREELGLETELSYDLLNMDANKAWKDEGQDHFISLIGTSMDELRYGMALNPHLRVLVSHGFHDLVTPYASAQRLARQFKGQTLELQHYPGGHMFYSHAGSREAFTARVSALLA